MNTAANMQVISLEMFRDKLQRKERAYTSGERALTMHEAIEKVNLSRATINRWEKAGKFPAKRYFGSQVRWLESEIDEWMLKQKGNYNAQ